MRGFSDTIVTVDMDTGRVVDYGRPAQSGRLRALAVFKEGLHMLARLFALITLALVSCGAFAQSLTTAQINALRTGACADTGAAKPLMLAGNEPALLAWFNSDSGFVVWRTFVSNEELGDAMNGTEVAGLSSLNMQRLQVLAAYSRDGQNMARADRRAAFDSVFSGAGGQTTRAAMATLWKRTATHAERILGSGTGTTGSPGLVTFEGQLGSAATVVFNLDGTLRGC